jgi:hypothetical protein
VSKLCRVGACANTVAGEKRANMFGESDRERNLHDTCVEHCTCRKVNREKHFSFFLDVFEKTDEGFKGLST